MQKSSTQTRKAKDVCHQLWLIYAQLKEAESDPERRLELLQRSREELGQAVNGMSQSRFQKEIYANATSSER
jgi:hypothetical protein